MTDQEALEKLIKGNQEYCDTHTNSSSLSEAERKYHVENGQHPYACIISCSDSRVVVEHIFSVGLGALFTIRTAGNVIGAYEIGSVEYAVEHLHVPLVVVMGHTHCGAVASAIDGNAHGNIKKITDKIASTLTDLHDIRQCEWENAIQGANELLNSPVLKQLVADDKVRIIPAIYDTECGHVTFKTR